MQIVKVKSSEKKLLEYLYFITDHHCVLCFILPHYVHRCKTIFFFCFLHLEKECEVQKGLRALHPLCDVFVLDWLHIASCLTLRLIATQAAQSRRNVFFVVVLFLMISLAIKQKKYFPSWSVFWTRWGKCFAVVGDHCVKIDDPKNLHYKSPQFSLWSLLDVLRNCSRFDCKATKRANVDLKPFFACFTIWTRGFLLQSLVAFNLLGVVVLLFSCRFWSETTQLLGRLGASTKLLVRVASPARLSRGGRPQM